MTTIKIDNKEYQIKFGLEVTTKSGILSKIGNFETSGTGALEQVEKAIDLCVDIMLEGLQKMHKKQFGYDHNTGAGKEAMREKVYSLIEDYFDDEEEEHDIYDLYQTLLNELTESGFFKNLMRRMETANQTENQK